MIQSDVCSSRWNITSQLWGLNGLNQLADESTQCLAMFMGNTMINHVNLGLRATRVNKYQHWLRHSMEVLVVIFVAQHIISSRSFATGTNINQTTRSWKTYVPSVLVLATLT